MRSVVGEHLAVDVVRGGRDRGPKIPAGYSTVSILGLCGFSSTKTRSDFRGFCRLKDRLEIKCGILRAPCCLRTFSGVIISQREDSFSELGDQTMRVGEIRKLFIE